MKKTFVVFLCGAAALAWAGQAASTQTQKPAGEPDRVHVQHILIAFKGSIPSESVTRTQAEAKTLADAVLSRARKGEDFKELVKKYTDDQYPGKYRMSNFGVEPITTPADKKEYPRARMVPGFGDCAFKLKVGEIGIAPYDPKASKYGWHIIMRLE